MGVDVGVGVAVGEADVMGVDVSVGVAVGEADVMGVDVGVGVGGEASDPASTVAEGKFCCQSLAWPAALTARMV